MSPASDSRLKEPMTYPHRFIPPENSIKDENYCYTPHHPADGLLSELSVNYTQEIFSVTNTHYQQGKPFGFYDRMGLNSDYAYGDENQPLEPSYADEDLNRNYSGVVKSFCNIHCHRDDLACCASSQHEHISGEEYYHCQPQCDFVQNQTCDNTNFVQPMINPAPGEQYTQTHQASEATDNDHDVINSLVSICSTESDCLHGKAQENEDSCEVTKKTGSVARRNARERKRIKNVNQAFDSLRQRVPQGSKGNKISKVETLRSAIEYIRALQELVTEKRSAAQSELSTDSVNKEISDQRFLEHHDDENFPPNDCRTSENSF